MAAAEVSFSELGSLKEVAVFTLRESIEFMFQKSNKPVLVFNNKDIVGFIENRYSQGAAIQNQVFREAMKKNRTTAFSKLDKTFPCPFFICVLFYLVFYHKCFASTDIAIDQMRIHIALKICSTTGN